MRVLHAEQVEIFFPIRPLFRERRITEADLDPMCHSVFGYACLLHIAQVFVTGDRTAAKYALINRPDESAFSAGFQSSLQKVTHGLHYHLIQSETCSKMGRLTRSLPLTIDVARLAAAPIHRNTPGAVRSIAPSLS